MHRDLEMHRLKNELNVALLRLKQVEEGCDGKCALNECVCPKEGWEEFTEKRVAKEILHFVKNAVGDKDAISLVDDYVQKNFLSESVT